MKLKTRGLIRKSFEIVDYTPNSQAIFELKKIKSANENILQIDGGGIKGLLPAYWLYTMEFYSGKPLCDYFKTLWGTSTGAIITAFAAKWFSMREVLKFYIEKGPSVFLRNSLFGLVGTKFTPENIEKEMRSYFPEEETFLSMYKKTKIELNITMVDARLRKTLVANYKRSPTMPVWKALRASTAAPYYFGPFIDKGRYFDEQTGDENVYFDGGSGIFNNASEKAFNQAYYIKKIPAKQIFILSLGTGKDTQKTDIGSFRNMAGLKQALWAFDYGREESVCEQVDELGYLKKDPGLQYFRYNIDTPKELNPMDDTNNIPRLLALIDKK